MTPRSEHNQSVEEIFEHAIHHGAVHLVDTVAHKAIGVPPATVTLAELIFRITLGSGDVNVEGLELHAYVAGCDGDHDGASWSGPYRMRREEMLDDLARHEHEWPH